MNPVESTFLNKEFSILVPHNPLEEHVKVRTSQIAQFGFRWSDLVEDRFECLVKREHSNLFRCSSQYIQRLWENQGTPTTIRTIIVRGILTSSEEKYPTRGWERSVRSFCLPHSGFFDIFGVHSFASVLDSFPLSCGSNGQAVGVSVFDGSSIVSH
jgi:hypothetical protein